MGPADTFSRVIKGRPEREQRDKETPENRAPVKCHRGSLQDFENEDTGERAVSLPRRLGIPQQRVTFLKGNASDEVEYNSDYEEDMDQEEQRQPLLGTRTKKMEDQTGAGAGEEDQIEEMTEISIDASSREMQGRQLTEQQIEVLSTEQKASIEKLERTGTGVRRKRANISCFSRL